MQAIQFLLEGGEEDCSATAPGSFASFRELSSAESGLLLPATAAHVLGVSIQAVMDLIARKRLRSWEFFGKCYVSAKDIAERQTTPRDKGGRPRKAQLQAA